MRDLPDDSELLEAIGAFLRDEAVPNLAGRPAFLARVAANAVDILRREREQAPGAEAAARERLEALLGRPGTLEALNEALCEAIAAGELTLETPGLAEHLWASTLDRLAVDQPRYSGYLRALEQRQGR
ncbi:hypothetical protein H0Z60_19525 [Ectothiorhodospiraceae bacterium WFHF3C12]|nr:hypothetical protein [Ectothiorhodospiraceae bacterium WFHF3C12]